MNTTTLKNKDARDFRFAITSLDGEERKSAQIKGNEIFKNVSLTSIVSYPNERGTFLINSKGKELGVLGYIMREVGHEIDFYFSSFEGYNNISRSGAVHFTEKEIKVFGENIERFHENKKENFFWILDASDAMIKEIESHDDYETIFKNHLGLD